MDRNNIILTKVQLKSITVSPEKIENELPAYQALEESQFRFSSIDVDLVVESIELGVFKFEDSSDTLLAYEIIEDNLLNLTSAVATPFDLDFKWNELLESYEIFAEIEIIFDYEYELRR